MNGLERYLSAKLRKAAARAGIELLRELEQDAENRTWELNVLNSGIKLRVDEAEKRLYGAVRKRLERVAGTKAREGTAKPPEKKTPPGLDPKNAV